MPSSQPLDVVTLVLSVWGATLSTILALRELNKDRRKIKVFVDYQGNISSDGDASTITVRTVNVGHRPIEIIKAGFMYERGVFDFPLTSTAGPSPLPHLLEDGESVSITYNLSDFESIMWDTTKDEYKEMKLQKAYAKDAEGRIYTLKLSREIKAFLNQATDNFIKKKS